MKVFVASALLICLSLTTANAQRSGTPKKKPVSAAELGDGSPFTPISFGNGIEFYDADTDFRLNLRFRVQNRAEFLHYEDAPDDDLNFNWAARRVRLRMNGTVYSPKLRYLVQLSFSRGDQDWSNSRFSNIVRDAIFTYDLTDHWQVAFGQGKLPGNRQRVVSSGDQQFVDRSIVNAAFNFDRDFGFQTQYELPLGGTLLRLKASITSGEGRNQSVAFDEKLFYTSRVEWLPFGLFKQSGDYFESDIAYEPTLKASFGYTAAYLDGAARANGAVGEIFTTTGDLEDPLERRTQIVHYADAIFKYQGHSLYLEYVKKTAKDPIINPDQAVLVGDGFNIQIGKMFTPKLEVALRHSYILPESEIESIHPEVKEWSAGVNYFLNGHRVKLQGNIGHTEGMNTFGRLQMELGI